MVRRSSSAGSAALLEKTAAGFEHIGFRPGKVNAIAASLGEASGGALLATGIGSPGAGAAIAGTMIVASSMHIDNGFFSNNGGFEFPAVLGLSAAALALTGPGTLSIDHVLGHRLNQPWMRSLALAAVVQAAFAVIARRRRAVAGAAKDIALRLNQQPQPQTTDNLLNLITARPVLGPGSVGILASLPAHRDVPGGQLR